MKREALMGVLRHVLTTAGGALVAAGKLDPEIATESTGVLLALVGLVWSIVSKRER